ncbi:ABC transporter substrate-binding protein [Roseateles sp. NT4]|uniref:ABC transporter substrate-binding protein n=1 Tax=Roseateles sp. NT4 TaxID=3453715 RepID=UPI003EEA280F
MRPIALTIGLCTALSLGLTTPSQAATISIAVPSGPVSLPLLVAIEQRLFQAEGLDVVRIPCNSGKACLAALRSGAADIAASAEFAVAMTATQTPAVAILASISESTAQIKLIASRRAGVRSSADMAGKRIATVAGTSAEYFLDRWLTYQGIDPERVKLRFAEPAALGDLVQQGQAAAAVVWEPEAGRIEDKLAADAVRLPSAHVYTQHFCIAVQARAVDRDRGRFDKVLRALLRAQHAIAESPAEAQALLAASLKVNPSVAQRLMAEQEYRIALHASLPTTMLSQVRWQLGQDGKSTEPAPSIQQLIDARPLQSIAPNAVTLAR